MSKLANKYPPISKMELVDYDDFDDFDVEYSKTLKENKNIKRTKGDGAHVYCHLPYAQSLYDLYSNKPTAIPIKFGELMSGTVVSVNEDFAVVNVSAREDVVLDIRKEKSDYLKYIQVGFPIDVLVNSKVSKTSSIGASFSKNVEKKKEEEIKDAIDKPIAFLGNVAELIPGGYYVEIDGIRCFMPGSHGGINKLMDFESLIGQQLYVMAIGYSTERSVVIVSHKDYLKTLIPAEISNLQIGVQYTGHVTGISKSGIFVEFNNCLTGLIARNEINKDKLDDFDNKRIYPGESINFYVKEVIDNQKIVLSQNLTVTKSVWDDIDGKYSVPSIVTGKVKKVVKYGAFIELEPSVVGLLHKSNFDQDVIELEPGQDIEVKLIRIDKENKQLDFSV